MANEIIDAGIAANNNRQNELGTVQISSLVGYVFFLDSSSVLQYRKTTDGGASWGSAVTVAAGLSAGVGMYSVWADFWTPGDTGTLIHITYGDRDAPDFGAYITLDTSDDSLSSAVTVVTGVSVTQSLQFSISITKAKGGNLCIGGQWGTSNDVANRGFWRSTDSGASWTEVADVTEVSTADHVQLFPGNEADNQDIWCIYIDESALEISLKVYDNSADSWSETAIATLTSYSKDQKFTSGAVRPSDGHLFMIHYMRSFGDATSNNLRSWEINGAGSITERGTVDTQIDFAGVALEVDVPASTLRAAFIRAHGGFQVERRIWIASSSDGAVSWASPVQFSDTPGSGTEEEIVNVSQPQVASSSGGWLQPIYVDNWDDDLMTNNPQVSPAITALMTATIIFLDDVGLTLTEAHEMSVEIALFLRNYLAARRDAATVVTLALDFNAADALAVAVD